LFKKKKWKNVFFKLNKQDEHGIAFQTAKVTLNIAGKIIQKELGQKFAFKN
jgi:hypothetical protein